MTTDKPTQGKRELAPKRESLAKKPAACKKKPAPKKLPPKKRRRKSEPEKIERQKKQRHWLSQIDLAKSIGISPNAFQAWGVTPVAAIGRCKYYVYSDVVKRDPKYRAALLQAEKSLGKNDTGDIDITRERLLSAQADAQEMKNEVVRHEVAPFNFLTYLLARVANEVAGVHDGLPAESMRQMNLTLEQTEILRALVARASDSISRLGDEEFVKAVLDEFINGTDFKL